MMSLSGVRGWYLQDISPDFVPFWSKKQFFRAEEEQNSCFTSTHEKKNSGNCESRDQWLSFRAHD
jgi:hypothetical protein